MGLLPLKENRVLSASHWAPRSPQTLSCVAMFSLQQVLLGVASTSTFRNNYCNENIGRHVYIMRCYNIGNVSHNFSCNNVARQVAWKTAYCKSAVFPAFQQRYATILRLTSKSYWHSRIQSYVSLELRPWQLKAIGGSGNENKLEEDNHGQAACSLRSIKHRRRSLSRVFVDILLHLSGVIKCII